MSRDRLERWGALSGVAFVVVMVAGFALAGNSPDTSASDAKIVAYLSTHSHQTANIAAFFFVLLAGLCLLGFFAVLRARLIEAEGGAGGLGALALGAGVASTVFLLTAVSLFIAPLIVANDASHVAPDVGVYRFTQDAGYELWVASVVIGALAIWATAAVVLRTGILGRWFGRLSIAIGVINLLAIFFIPIFVFYAWIALTSILLTLRRAPATAPAGPAAEPLAASAV
jgi:hypothetical protein